MTKIVSDFIHAYLNKPVYKIQRYGSNEINAVRIFRLSQVSSTTRKSEIIGNIYKQEDISKVLDHQNILKIDHSFEFEKDIYLIMEYCKYKSLSQRLYKKQRKHKSTKEYCRGFCELEVKYFMKQMLDAIDVFHCKGYLHRNLSLHSVYLNGDMMIKVGNYGYALNLNKRISQRDKFRGEIGFIAPELINRLAPQYNFASDIWSLGIMFYQLLTSRLNDEFSEHIMTQEGSNLRSFLFSQYPKVSAAAQE